MNGEFKREDRYMVFKISDIVEHCTKTEALHLARLYEIQRVGRKDAGKVELECVVVESDWPEYEPTWKAIEARVTGAQPAPSTPDGWKQLVQELVREVERNTCTHEETHRGGFIWEICDMCGAKWADDEGGKPEFRWPDAVEKARAMLVTAAPNE